MYTAYIYSVHKYICISSSTHKQTILFLMEFYVVKR